MNRLARHSIGTSPIAKRMEAAAAAAARQRAAEAERRREAEARTSAGRRAPSPRAWAEAEIARWAELQPHITVRIKPAWLRIAEEVAASHGLTVRDLVGESRLQSVVRPRHEAIYRIYDETPLSTLEIGHRFGGRDHTTVLHGIRVHAERNGLPLPRAEDGEVCGSVEGGGNG